jgi:hypothetical protein
MNGGLIVYEYRRGAHLYGLDTDKSDQDFAGVFMSPIYILLGNRSFYKEQINLHGDDHVVYELGRWIELLVKGNPNIIEGLFVDYENIITEPEPSLEPIFNIRQEFLTKKFVKILSEYGYSQIRKAQGLNKMIVNPVEEGKNILDFCYTFDDQGSIPIKEWLYKHNLKNTDVGAVNVPHMSLMYSLFRGNNYRGLINDDETSNDVRLSSVAEGEKPVCYMYFNQTGYTKYCIDLRNYKEWLNKRNPERYRVNQEHGKSYDSKNASHCIRLLNMAKELVEGKGFILNRKNVDRNYLLSIKNGEMEYQEFLNLANNIRNYIDNNIEESNLPYDVDICVLNDILINIRKEFYKDYFKCTKHTIINTE